VPFPGLQFPLEALLDSIGPSVVIVHSQAGTYGPDVVRALVTVEGGCDDFTDKDASSSFAKVPVLSLCGDNSVGAKQTVNGDARRNGCLAAVNAIKVAGRRATLTLLPDAGIKGSSHMMMMDKNNLQVAKVILKWLGENAK
jgi:hypothetical protein